MPDRLAQEIDRNAGQRSLVLMMTRLQDVLGEIDELASSETPCAADQIAQRRARPHA